ncbi:MAG TPA: DNA replication/repair protein RecF [Alphaproteobacteria bacterium]
MHPGTAGDVATDRGIAAVTRLTLSDFRCYARLRLDIGREPVVLTGPNGAGKTNLLEALSFLAPGRGLRRAKLAEPDRRAADGTSCGPWAVAAMLETSLGMRSVGTGREGDGGERRSVRIDGTAAHQKDLSAILSVVWLAPDMDRLFLEGPSARRRFLDRLVFGFDPEHAGRVAAYEHCLRERSRLLAEGSADPAWLDALEDGMARHGIAIAAARATVAARLDRAAAEGIGPFPSAAIALTGDVHDWLAEMPALAAEERLRAALAGARSADAQLGGASAGPHRADLAVRFAAKDRPAAECSTGEQKALLLSIILAVARELIVERGQPPLLLLDEVVAHLDGARRAALFDEIAALGAQAWLTGTDDELFAGLRGRAQFFRVLDATLTPR